MTGNSTLVRFPVLEMIDVGSVDQLRDRIFEVGEILVIFGVQAILAHKRFQYIQSGALSTALYHIEMTKTCAAKLRPTSSPHS